jgi:hypothetical protein
MSHSLPRLPNGAIDVSALIHRRSIDVPKQAPVTSSRMPPPPRVLQRRWVLYVTNPDPAERQILKYLQTPDIVGLDLKENGTTGIVFKNSADLMGFSKNYCSIRPGKLFRLRGIGIRWHRTSTPRPAAP